MNYAYKEKISFMTKDSTKNFTDLSEAESFISLQLLSMVKVEFILEAHASFSHLT